MTLSNECTSFDEDFAMDLDYQSDTEYAAQLEHEWLKVNFALTVNVRFILTLKEKKY